MSDQQLFLPERLRVGFKNRKDTYTGKLAFVIYYDKRGKLRKERSWEGWRSKDIDPVEYDNKPTEGFVLNKGVGGARGSWSSRNVRNEYIRVYDPRDFEFEISVANLLFILRECDCSRGKGLEGKFVYAWDGKELVLLPVGSQDHAASQAFTEIQGRKVSARDLIKGATYLTKQQDELVYIGRHEFHFVVTPTHYSYKSKRDNKGCRKMHVFWDGERFQWLPSMQKLSVLKSADTVSNYAELVDKLYKMNYGTKVKDLFLKKDPNHEVCQQWYVENPNGGFIEYHSYTPRRYSYGRQHTDGPRMLDGAVIERKGDTIYYRATNKYTHRYSYDYHNQTGIIVPPGMPTNQQLYATLESGTIVKFSSLQTNGAV